MRTVKFRGKSCLSNKWLYGDLMHYCGATLILPLDANWYDFVPKKDNPFRLPSSKFEVDPATVGQFTGLTDRKGHSIHEGDIVKMLHFHGHYGVVQWNDEGYFFINRDYPKTKELDYPPLGDNSNCIEVIGNIHDNPDLLMKVGAP